MIATTDNEFVLSGAYGGIPITYERKTAQKNKIDLDKLWIADKTNMKNSIGRLTNLSTSMYAYLENSKDTDEREVIEKRIKITTPLQSCEIDKNKGIQTMDIPEHWATWQTWSDKDSDELIQKKKFNNKIVVTQKPYFMIYTYPNKGKQYRQHVKNYEEYSLCHFGITLEELLEQGSGGDKDKQKAIDFYYRYSPIVSSPSVMNKICHCMENTLNINRSNTDLTLSYDVDSVKLERMKELYREWNNGRIQKEDEEVEQTYLYRRKADEISTNGKEIAKLAIMVNKRFANNIFQEEILDLFRRKSIEIPVICSTGDKIFNGNKYKIISFSLED